MRILPGDLSDPRVLGLLSHHLSSLRAITPPEGVYALDVTALRAPDITFRTLWEGDQVLGCGALKEIDPASGEVKSMRTDPAHLRRGVATRILDDLLTLARVRGYRRVSLETGRGEAFEPALALYRRHGFVDGPAFAEYRASEFNQFLHLELPA